MARHFISSDIYRPSGYGKAHPLGIARIGTVLNLCEILGWLDKTGPGAFIDSDRAEFDDLVKYHTPDYVKALIKAEKQKSVPPAWREKYRLGTMENPIFDGLYERASTSVGGSIQAARLTLEDKDENSIAYHPSGGTHHGMAGHASGFCYFNDPVFAVLTYLEAGLTRVLYIDLDAHHGDGVEAAFCDDERVFLISVHEQNRWPHTGKLEDRGKKDNARNLPVPEELNDSEFDFIVEKMLLPLVSGYKPEAMVITCGADPLIGDPLSKMALSNSCLLDAVMALTQKSPKTVIVGGGGYNPWTVARCWTGLWGRIKGYEFSERLPDAATRLMQSLECDLVDEDEILPHWLDTLADPRNDGKIRDAIAERIGVLLR